MRELVFDVVQEADGRYCAEAIGESIFSQGDTWEELREMMKEPTQFYFEDSKEEVPISIRLHLRRDEVLAVA